MYTSIARVHLILLLLLVTFEEQGEAQDTIQNRIPSYLRECYSKPSLYDRAKRMPATIGTLISLLQKAERNERTEKYGTQVGGVLDARVMSYSILHRFRLDGIERVPGIPDPPFIDNDDDTNTTDAWEGIIPYATTGLQFKRYKILFSELIPGNAILFPNSTLQPHEKCALHFMLSSTFDLRQRGDESTTCRGAHTLKPGPTTRYSECPLEDGVVAIHSPYSSRTDTVSPGAVLAGIAAALEHQEVPVSTLMKFTDIGPVNDKLTGDNAFHDLLDAPPVLNTWAATLAGDLSEVAILQGPYKLKTSEKERESVKADVVVGVDGWWGGGPIVSSATDIYSIDSRIGRWYYIMRNSDLEMTDAEIRGGIDGLLLGSAVIRWNRSAKGRLRLSQILEMYYSEKGMAAYDEPDLKWCNRFENFMQGSGAGGGNTNENNLQILLSQTMSFAKVLYEHTYSVQFDDTMLQEFVQVSAKQFQRYLTNDIDYQHCANGYYGHEEQLPGYPHVDLYVVTDGTWIGGNFTKLMGYLAEECDVSLFGSRMSVLHGRMATWMLKDAKSAAEVSYNITKELRKVQYKGKVPGLDVMLALTKLSQRINDKILSERIRNIVKEIRPQVVLFLAHRELVIGGTSRIQQSMETFRKQNPDVHTILVSVDSVVGPEDPFAKLGGQFVKTTGSRPSDVVPAVLRSLRMVPGRIIAYNCDGRRKQRIDMSDDGSPAAGHHELEDYVTPGEPRVYRLHPVYFNESKVAKIQFVGSGYGDITICMTRHRPDEPRSVSKADCHQMTAGTADFVFEDPCPGGVPYVGECLPIYFTVNVTKSFYRCTEDDCRFPDQVRFSVWNQVCNGAATHTIPSVLICTVVAFIVSSLRLW